MASAELKTGGAPGNNDKYGAYVRDDYPLDSDKDDSKEGVDLKLTNSLLFSGNPPLMLNLCLRRSDFKNATCVTVEYLDRTKLKINLNTTETICAHILGVSVSHLVAPMDYSSFCLAFLEDGEYVVLDPIFSMNEVMTAHFQESEPYFYLRLKFMPDDINFVIDNNIVKAMYMQTRRDLLDGFFNCTKEESLLLAAYSLQYELGDLQVSSTFRVRDYLPADILTMGEQSQLRMPLESLYARLKGMSRGTCRQLFIKTAMELEEFGAHSVQVFLTRKCNSDASGRLLVGPHGLNIIQNSRFHSFPLNDFCWEELDKVSFKGDAISLVSKSGTCAKLYVKSAYRSKYIVVLLGQAHKYYRLQNFPFIGQSCYVKTLPGTNRTISCPDKCSSDKMMLQCASSTTLIAENETDSLLSNGNESPQITPFQMYQEMKISTVADSGMTEFSERSRRACYTEEVNSINASSPKRAIRDLECKGDKSALSRHVFSNDSKVDEDIYQYNGEDFSINSAMNSHCGDNARCKKSIMSLWTSG